MSLPTVDDLVFIIFLLIPGFFTIALFKKIGRRQSAISDLELTIWSLFASLGIYAIFASAAFLANWNISYGNILNPVNIASVSGLAIIFGGGFGLLSRYTFRKTYSENDCWHKCVDKAANIGSYILVYTSDGKEYKGEFILGGVCEANKELVINNPKLIIRDKSLNVVSELEIGETILFTEKDIFRVVFLKKVAEPRE